MAGIKPKFLTDLIQQHNSKMDQSATIPFNILEETLKKLIHTFTTVLFTKLNYPEIFASPATIPPHKTQNRLQFCINLACLHLYLSNNYHAINYTKFAEDIKLRPKRFKISSKAVSYDKNQQYLSINMDNHFNIQLDFNIPKTLFMEKYNIPSLKNSLFHFNEWFERVFPLYSRQFTTTIDKTKVSNYLKYQFRQHFITHLKELLPTTHEFAEPNDLQE